MTKILKLPLFETNFVHYKNAKMMNSSTDDDNNLIDENSFKNFHTELKIFKNVQTMEEFKLS